MGPIFYTFRLCIIIVIVIDIDLQIRFQLFFITVNMTTDKLSLVLQPNFFLDLPNIPPPSPELEELLKEFHSKDSSIPNKSKVRRHKGKTKINAFLGFRAYYSEDIRSSVLQKDFSKRLADIWKSYPHQAAWYRFANLYTAEGTGQSFSVWLHVKLWNKNQDHALKISKSKWKSYNAPRRSLVVEDVFYVGNTPNDTPVANATTDITAAGSGQPLPSTTTLHNFQAEHIRKCQSQYYHYTTPQK